MDSLPDKPLLESAMVVMKDSHCWNSASDASAVKLGIPVIDNQVLVTPEVRQYFEDRRTDGPSDTVGAIAIDKNGNAFEQAFGVKQNTKSIVDLF